VPARFVGEPDLGRPQVAIVAVRVVARPAIDGCDLAQLGLALVADGDIAQPTRIAAIAALAAVVPVVLAVVGHRFVPCLRYDT